MAGSSSSQAAPPKEYVVRVPKSQKKRFHMMRFNADLGADFFKSWSQCKLERENNLKEYKMEEEVPKFGAGSEFGREQREEARRKRYGINVKKYKSEDQPWMLNIGGKGGKKYKGIREGGVAENVSWYVFMQGKDGAFEAYPIEEWYNFQPVQRYKALSAEEAEEEFIRRDKIMNYFQVMYEKKFKKDSADVDEEEGKKKGSKKSLMLSEMDDWVSDDDDEEDEEKNEEDDDSDGGKKKKKKKRVGRKKQTGGKTKKREGDHSDNSCEEESDDFNEGAEQDYISSDSSDSDQENEELVSKELAGVEEGDALKKLLASDEEDENEEGEKDKEEGEENKEEETEDKEKKKKKKKKNDKKSDKDSDESDESSADETKKKKDTKHLERKSAVNELKRKVKENPIELLPDSKRMKMDPSTAGGSNAGAPGSADSMEETIRRYLMRKPMTTTELLKNFKKKKDMNSEQLVTSIAQILKRVNPVKRTIKGKMYLSLRPS